MAQAPRHAERGSNFRRRGLAAGVVACILVILEAGLMTYMCFQKQGFDIDETYSYILSNSHDADKLSSSDELWGQWLSPEDWETYVAVEPGEGFAYDVVYQNNTTDAHPPLYYWALHTISSLFPGTFSIWFGLALNLGCFVIALTLLYVIARRIFSSEWLALAPMALWGMSLTAIDTVTFIRMYAMLTVFTLLSALIHIDLAQRGQTPARLAAAFATTFLGTFTQYYFAIFAFSIALCYGIWRLLQRDIKGALVYGTSQIAAIALVFVAYPAGITQITGSSTNNVGNEVSSNILNLSGWGTTIRTYLADLAEIWSCGLRLLGIGKKLLAGIVAAILGLSAIVSLIARRTRGAGAGAHLGVGDRAATLPFALVCIVVAALSIAIISKASSTYVYQRYIYNIVPVLILGCVGLLDALAAALGAATLPTACALLAVSLVNGLACARWDQGSYLYQSKAETYEAIMEGYGDVPVVVVCDRVSYPITANFHFLREYSNVLIVPQDSLGELSADLASQSTEDGILLVVWTDKDWGDGYDGDAVSATALESLPEYQSLEAVDSPDVYFCSIYYVS